MTAEELVQLAMGPFSVGAALGFSFAVFTGFVMFAIDVIRAGFGGRGS